MSKTVMFVDVPARGRKWVAGAILRDGMNLYRVAPGKPQLYHGDCPARQKVTKVRDIPERWKATQRIMAIMESITKYGMTRSGSYSGPRPDAGKAIRWEAAKDRQSYATWDILTVWEDYLMVSRYVYDDDSLLAYVEDAVLAREVRELLKLKPDLCEYEERKVTTIKAS